MNLRLTTGVEIPNGDFAFKSDGAGRTGPPDGWTKSAQWVTDENAGRVFASWEPLQRYSSLADAPVYGSGRALRIALQKEAVSSGTRYLESPLSPAGQVLGADQVQQGNDFKYRLRYLWHGEADVAPSDGDWYVEVLATNAARTYTVTIASAINIYAADWDLGAWTKGWMWRESPLVTLVSTAWGSNVPDHLLLRLHPKVKSTGPTGSFLSGLFGAFVLETLSPAETGYAVGAALLQNPFVGYWELSRPMKWREVRPAQYVSLSRASRLPSGRRRTLDVSGGVAKRTFSYGVDLLTPTDREKLWRLWRLNKGYPSDSGTSLGKPLPLVLMPGTPDLLSEFAQVPQVTDTYPPAAYYVDFADDEFPLQEHSGAFQPGAASAQRYSGVLRFEER